MIERLIYTVIRDGLDALIANPVRLLALLERQNLATAEAERIRDYVIATGAQVLHGYPRLTETRFPSYAIILSSEQETRKFLDSSGGIIDAEDRPELGEDYVGSEIHTSIYSYEYVILTLERRPDMVLAYYQILKFLLSIARDRFLANGVLTMSFSGGDLMPDPRYVPADIFVRQFTFSCEAEQPYILDNEITNWTRDEDGVVANTPRERITSVNLAPPVDLELDDDDADDEEEEEP